VVIEECPEHLLRIIHHIRSIIMYDPKTTLIILITILAGCGSAPEESAVTLPMEVAGGAPVIELTIEGRGPFRFVLDTGASMGVILPVLADELGLPIGSDPEHVVVLKNVVLGPLALGDLEAGIIDFPLPERVRGIISAATLADYLVKLNYPSEQLIVTKGTLNAAADGHVVPYTLTPLVTIDITIGKQVVPVHLDTGSPAFCSIPDATASRLEFGNDLREVGMARVPGKEVPVRRGLLNGDLTIAGHSFTDPEIDVATLMGPYGNIGYAFLKDKILTLDQKNQLLRIVGSN
jgi:hypothetical protein